MSAALRLARYTVRRRRFAPLAWGLPLGLMAVLVVAIFPSIERSQELEQLIDSYPEALKSAFEISDASFQTIQGYMQAEMFSMIVPLTASVYVIRALADGICGDERRGALDVLLSAPLTRGQLVWGLLAGTIAVLAAILAVLGVLMWAAALLFGVDLPARDVAAGVAGMLPLAVFFAGVAAVLAGVLHRSGPVMGIAAGTLLAMYLLEVLGAVSDVLGPVQALSAFHYYGAPIQEGIHWPEFLGLWVAGLVLVAVGAALFERRDNG